MPTRLYSYVVPSPSPDNQIGTLTSTYGLTMIPGSKLIIKVNPEGSTDLLQIKGAHLNIEPGSNVEVIGLGPDFPPLSTYTIVQTTEPIIGHFDRVVIGSNGHFKAP